MLYVTTRNQYDAYTAHRTLLADHGQDGALYVPFRMVTLDRQQILNLAEKSFGQRVAETLNRFYSCGLTGWDVEFCVGRYPAKMVDMGQRITAAQQWQNQAWDYSWAEQALARKICGDLAVEHPSAWLRIAIRVAFLTAVFGEMIAQGMTDPEHPVDVAVPAGDFSIPMSVWYARQMGLPVANIICGCEENSPVWDLLQQGSVKIDGAMPVHLEQLVCETLGHKEASRYADICSNNGSYNLLPVDAEKLSAGIFAAVISTDRVSSVISNVNRTTSQILSADSAVGYAGLQDFRAKTGENRPALLLAERSPLTDSAFVAGALGMTAEELKEKFQ